MPVVGELLWSVATTYPTPWVIAASVLTGAAASRATRRTRASPDPDVARVRKWLPAVILLCCAVLAWLLAVFVPGPERISNPKYLFYYLGVSAACAVGFRFRKAAGLPLVLLVVAAGAFAGLFAMGLESSRGEAEIGRVVVYGRRGSAIDLEVRFAGRAAEYVELEGDRVVPLVTSVLFDDLWPVLGWRFWYRIEGVGVTAVTAGEGEAATLRRAEEPRLLERQAGAPERLYAQFVRVAPVIPGVRIVRSDKVAESALLADAGYDRAEDLAEYVIRLRADGEAVLARAAEAAGGLK